MYRNGESSRQGAGMGWTQGSGSSDSTSEASRDMSWSQGSASANNSFQFATRMNTVLITNIAPNTTRKQLLEKIAIAGPFGKLYSVHMRPASNPQRDNTMKVLVCFFSREAAVHFLAYVANQGICVQSRPIRAQETEVPSPDTIEPQGRHDSRVLIFEDYTLENLYTLFSNLGMGRDQVQQITKFKNPSRARHIGLVFLSYADAKLVLDVMASVKNARAYYGRDPMEAGVRTGYDYVKSTPGNLHIEVYISKWFIDDAQGHDAVDSVYP